jgi:hypothetical protein
MSNNIGQNDVVNAYETLLKAWDLSKTNPKAFGGNMFRMRLKRALGQLSAALHKFDPEVMSGVKLFERVNIDASLIAEAKKRIILSEGKVSKYSLSRLLFEGEEGDKPEQKAKENHTQDRYQTLIDGILSQWVSDMSRTYTDASWKKHVREYASGFRREFTESIADYLLESKRQELHDKFDHKKD